MLNGTSLPSWDFSEDHWCLTITNLFTLHRPPPLRISNSIYMYVAYFYLAITHICVLYVPDDALAKSLHRLSKFWFLSQERHFDEQGRMCSNNGSTTYFYFSITKQKLVSCQIWAKNRMSLSCIGGIAGRIGSVKWSWWFWCRVMLANCQLVTTPFPWTHLRPRDPPQTHLIILTLHILSSSPLPSQARMCLV